MIEDTVDCGAMEAAGSVAFEDVELNAGKSAEVNPGADESRGVVLSVGLVSVLGCKSGAF